MQNFTPSTTKPDFEEFHQAVDPGPPPRQPLKIFSALDLAKMEIPDQPWVIPGLWPFGLVVLGGPAKSGKSYFILQTLLSLATGAAPFGCDAWTPGAAMACLYLALEDSLASIHHRIIRLNSQEHPPANLFVMIDRPEGGFEQLRMFLGEHPEIKVVVIDTWRILNPSAPSKGMDAYSATVAEFAPLRRIASEMGLALLIVCHLRKDTSAERAACADPFERLVGGGGMMASADAALLLERKRGEPKATLIGTGRVLPEVKYCLKWREDGGGWERDASGDDSISGEAGRVLALIRSGASRPVDVANETGMELRKVTTYIRRLLDRGLICRNGRGMYQAPVVSVVLLSSPHENNKTTKTTAREPAYL